LGTRYAKDYERGSEVTKIEVTKTELVWPGKYTIITKVIDIFGNNTSQAFEVEIKENEAHS
jgi:hypothetical protein